MTAICGIWHLNGRPDAAQRLRTMQVRLRPYGRDRADLWDGGDLALASSLTRLVPEDRFDRQPLIGADGRYVLIADLRLDNREDVVRDLGVTPVQAAVMADSDILLAGFERWQSDVVTRLVGPFCFVVFDIVARTLTLARDHLGQRSVYFHAAPDFFAFSTMPKALFALPEIPMVPNDVLLTEILLAAPTGTRKFFKTLDTFEIGHLMTVRADGTRTVSRYWDPEDVPTLHLKNPADYAEGLRDVFMRATASSLRTDKPVGSFLSAGYDSSAVTVAAARLLEARNQTLTAYTYVPRPGYDAPTQTGRQNDEGAIAALTAARHQNIGHHLVSPSDGELLRILDSAFTFGDVPVIAAINALWGTKIGRTAADAGIGVMLGGGFGNISISYGGEGYFYELFQAGRWLELARALIGLRDSRNFTRSIAMRQLARWSLVPGRWRRLRAIVGRPEPTDARPAWSPINQDLFYSKPIQDRLRSGTLKPPGASEPQARHSRNAWLRRAAGAVPTALKGVLAERQIDHRDPTSDRRVVEFCLSVPLREYMRDGRPRSLYRAAFADWLPPEVVEFGWTTRGRQSADWHPLLKAALPVLRDEVERMTGVPEAERLFDMAGLRAAIDDFPEVDDGQRGTEDVFHLKLLRGIGALHFLRRSMGLN